MNKIIIPNAVPNRASKIIAGIVLTIAMTFVATKATAVPTVDLGTASGFSLLAGSQITDAGGGSSIITGDVGLYPTTGAAIGLTAGQVLGGTIYQAETSGALLNGAQNDLTTAYIDAAGRSATVDFGVVDNQLGGKTLFPGVYRFGHAATANLIGTLTLDANGDLNPVWIFQATSDLITAAGSPGGAGSSVILINGASACDVFWQVGRDLFRLCGQHHGRPINRIAGLRHAGRQRVGPDRRSDFRPQYDYSSRLHGRERWWGQFRAGCRQHAGAARFRSNGCVRLWPTGSCPRLTLCQKARARCPFQLVKSWQGTVEAIRPVPFCRVTPHGF